MISSEIVRHAILSLGTEDEFGLHEALWSIDKLNPAGKGGKNVRLSADALVWLLDQGWITLSKNAMPMGRAAALDALKETGAFRPPPSGAGLTYSATASGEKAYQDGTCCPGGRR